MSLFLPEIALKACNDIDYNLLQRFGIKGLIWMWIIHNHTWPSGAVSRCDRMVGAR